MAASSSSVAVRDGAPGAYARRRPEHTLLHRLVSEHLEAFLAEARAEGRRGLPRYVERELRAYLECGILEHGFARAVCKACGREILVAFSCKRRGVCPCCNARRMCSTAAHLVDNVFPDVPVRQWVLSVPYELRLLLARRIDTFGELIRLFAREVFAWQKRVAKADGIAVPLGGGVTFPQRFGGSLNLNTHVHAVFVDGVFVESSGEKAALFVPLRAPTSLELTLLCERIYKRFARWLERNQLLKHESEGHGVDDAGDSDENDSEEAALDACARTALSRGDLGRVSLPPLRHGRDERARLDDELGLPRARKGKHVGEAGGFGIHAGVAIAKGNPLGRELLFRYCARPPFSLERLSQVPDGRFAYELRHPWRADQTHRIMTPLELLARLAALIPPPRHPLIQFHGVFAPHSSTRKRIVPTGSRHDDATGRAVPCATADGPGRTHDASESSSNGTAPSSASAAELNPSRAPVEPATARSSLAPAGRAAQTTTATMASASASASVVDTPTKASSWIDWATLLHRVYPDEVVCPCGGRPRIVELVIGARHARAHLARVGIDGSAPPLARARDPADFMDPPSPDT